MSDTTNRPKPHPFVETANKKETPQAVKKPSRKKLKEGVEPVKKPYVVKPHLTSKPFDNEQLQKLRSKMNESTTKLGIRQVD